MNTFKKSTVAVAVFVVGVVALLVLGLAGNPYPMVSAVVGIIAVISAAVGLTLLN